MDIKSETKIEDLNMLQILGIDLSNYRTLEEVIKCLTPINMNNVLCILKNNIYKLVPEIVKRIFELLNFFVNDETLKKISKLLDTQEEYVILSQDIQIDILKNISIQCPNKFELSHLDRLVTLRRFYGLSLEEINKRHKMLIDNCASEYQLYWIHVAYETLSFLLNREEELASGTRPTYLKEISMWEHYLSKRQPQILLEIKKLFIPLECIDK